MPASPSAHATPLSDPWRVTALRSTGLLGAEPSAVLDRIARTATRLLGVPVGLVSLVDVERVWFAGLTGLTGRAAEARQAPLSHSFCPHVVTSGAPLVVPDAAAHPLARESPEVDALGIAAYLGVPLTSADGAPLGALCAIDTAPHAWTAADLDALLDLAPGASAELRLREREARSWLAAEATDEVFYTHDYVTGRVTREGAVEAIYGVSADALAATDGAWLARVHPEDRDWVAASWQAALARGTGGWRCEYRMQHPDGRLVIVQDRARIVSAADGTAQRVAGTLTDVTDQRVAEAQRAALEARLRQGQKMEALGQLAGGIAHDFNNLLSVIGGNVDLLHGDLPPELPEGHPARRDLEEITHAAERARGLVRQLLTFSRQQPVRPERLQVGEAVRRIERLLRRVIGEEIVLAVDTADAGAAVLADAGQLEQILMNLAANARDAMLAPLHGAAGTGGTLDIAVDAVTLDDAAARDWDGASPGRWVRLRVRDTGHGMDAATQARVFEPFFTTKAVGRGTGLGLATVFGLVRQMGGAVRVESAPGRGSTFTVILPVADGDAETAPPPTRDGASSAAGTVLLVEDEAAVRATARRLLERLGYTVLEARDGADALTRWRRHRGGIDAVVTDVRMPELSGPAFVARVREDAPGTAVVFMSGYVDEDTSLAQAPHETFIEKPFTAEALAAALELVRGGTGRRRSSRDELRRP